MSTSPPQKPGMFIAAGFAALLGLRPDDMPRAKEPEANFDTIGDDATNGKNGPRQGDDDAEDHTVSGQLGFRFSTDAGPGRR